MAIIYKPDPSPTPRPAHVRRTVIHRSIIGTFGVVVLPVENDEPARRPVNESTDPPQSDGEQPPISFREENEDYHRRAPKKQRKRRTSFDR